MSAFYDLASLVVVPSGYKASKVYAQKPLTTDGQLTFSRGSTATRVNASGLIETVASNVPRLDYLGSSCPRLLLEPQRTNLVTYSEQIEDASWGLSNASITANATTSPDGTQNADKLYTNTATSTHQIRKTISSVTAQNYTMSIFAKKGELNFIRFWEDGQTGKQCYFNLNTGVATNVDMTSASIENMGNGWYRCIAVVAIPASGVFGYRVLLTPDGTTTSFTGNGSDGVFLYGAQLEASSYATSYIPTLGAAVTRGADAASKTGISSLIGQTEGTIFIDFDFTNISGVQVSVSIHDSANNKRLELFASSAALNAFIGGSVNITIGSSSITNGRHKAALAYKQSGDHAFYIDGVQIGTSATAYTIAALTALSFDYWNTGFPPTEKVAQALLFKTRLTNAQLAELTTI